MAVPDFQSFFKPLLDIAADGKEHAIKEAREKITIAFELNRADRRSKSLLVPFTAREPGKAYLLPLVSSQERPIKPVTKNAC